MSIMLLFKGLVTTNKRWPQNKRIPTTVLPNTPKLRYNESQYSEFRDILNKCQLPLLLTKSWYSEFRDIVNKRSLTRSFVISKFGVLAFIAMFIQIIFRKQHVRNNIYMILLMVDVCKIWRTVHLSINSFKEKVKD